MMYKLFLPQFDHHIENNLCVCVCTCVNVLTLTPLGPNFTEMYWVVLGMKHNTDTVLLV
jgi:hypothetical protein